METRAVCLHGFSIFSDSKTHENKWPANHGSLNPNSRAEWSFQFDKNKPCVSHLTPEQNLRCPIYWVSILLRPFFKVSIRNVQFSPLTLNQIANGFLHRILWFLLFKNFGSRNPPHPPSNFSNFWAPTFWCWCQSVLELLRGLKIGMSRFSTTLSLFFEIKNTSYALLRV